MTVSRPSIPVRADAAHPIERALAHALDRPDAPAVCTHDRQILTYDQLVRRAAALAEEFEGIVSDGLTVLTVHDEFAAIALLAGALAGRQLALVDPREPAERVRAITATIGYPVVAAVGLAECLVGVAPGLAASVAGTPTDGPLPTRAGMPDYLLTTSGSTSAPKAVVVPPVRWFGDDHDGFSHLRGRRLVVSAVGTYGHLNGLLRSMAIGGCAVLFDSGRGGTGELLDQLAGARVESLSAPPTLVRTLLRLTGGGAAEAPIRHINLRGEHVSKSDLRAAHALAPEAMIGTQYASTEAGHVASWAWWPGDPVPEGTLPVGPPGTHVDVCVRTADGSVIEGQVDEPLEILVSGPAVFSGYLGEEPIDTLLDHDGRQWYRTGDLGRIDRDGQLYIHGRLGRRVKVGGQFVDLDDVADAFEALAGVSQAAVTSFDDDGRTQLVGHLVPFDSVELDTVAARAELARRLPIHVVPAFVRVVTDPPKGRTGKLDQRALQAWRPPVVRHDGDEEARNRAALTSTRIGILASGFLGRSVGVDQDLIDTGMNSLQWLELVERISVEFGVVVDLNELFGAPTPRGIGMRIDRAGASPEVVTLANGSRRPAVLWTMLGLGAQRAVPLARALKDRPLHVAVPQRDAQTGGVPLRGRELVDALGTSTESGLPAEPLVVVGYSAGCRHAQALAARLASTGREVPLLVLVDPLVRRFRWRRPRAWVREMRKQVVALRAWRKRYSDSDSGGEVWELQIAASRRFRPGDFAGEVLLLRTSRQADLPKPSWLTGTVECVVVDDGHFGVVADGERLARLIETRLDGLRS